LITLDLTGNELASLPAEMMRLKNLKTIEISYNPLPKIPPEILAKEPGVILSFFFDNIRRPLNESKILIVGQGSVGKTSVRERLVHNTYNSHENKTEGIGISQWQIDDTHTENLQGKITLNLWDFGGQEIMHASILPNKAKPLSSCIGCALNTRRKPR
jgi:internalin A